MEHSWAVGIDLGTTNSVVSVYRKGRSETIMVDGRSTLPSVVSFQNSVALVGQEAKNRLQVFPEESVASVKRFMGDSQKRFGIDKALYSPVDIASLILKKLLEAASSELQTPVTNAVITVPAYFTEAQKLDTKQAGEKIGLNVLRLVPEPTAAAISYGLDKGRDQTILVYDLGGGTFDVSVLRVEGNSFLVTAVDGDSLLGGDDFDEAIVKHLMERFMEKHGMELLGSPSREYRIALQKLKEAAERAKIELSQAQVTEIIIPDLMGRPFSAELTREHFVEIIRPFLDRTAEKVDMCLQAAGLTSDEIDRVILVGGSTRIPAVREIVTQRIKEPYTSERVDEAVSHGASILAAGLYLPEEDMAPVEVTNVNAHSLGIEMMKPDYSGSYFQPIIKKNSVIPCNGGKVGSTLAPYQEEVIMKVYRGEDPEPSRNTYLGELALPISRPGKGLVSVAAVFELDADGIIHFTAYELAVNSNVASFLETVSGDGILANFEALRELEQTGDVKSVRIQIKVF